IYAATYYPRSLDEQSATPIEVGAGGESRGIDIRMVEVPAVGVRGTASGIPGGEAGRGRGAVMVGLAPRNGGAVDGARGNVRGAEGQFEIRGVQPGSYLLWARSGNAATEMFASQPVDVGASPV